MSITRAMVETALECARTPGYTSVWSPNLRRYICERDPEYKSAKSAQSISGDKTHHSIGSAFKLVFIITSSITFLCLMLCGFIAVFAFHDKPDLAQDLVRALITFIGTGLGAIVGLLGGQNLRVINPN
jgi:hypothetical protein